MIKEIRVNLEGSHSMVDVSVVRDEMYDAMNDRVKLTFYNVDKDTEFDKEIDIYALRQLLSAAELILQNVDK